MTDQPQESVPLGAGAPWPLLLVLALPACSLLSPPPPPVVPVAVPEHFTAGGTAPVDSRWWREFHDPELDRLVAEATGGNLDLRAQWDRLLQSEAIADKAGAALSPAVDAVAGYGITRARSESFLTRAPATTTTQDFLLGFTLSYEIDIWGRVRSGRRAAGYDLEAAAADVSATAMLLASRVAKAHYQLAEQEAILALLEDQRKTSETLLHLVEVRFQEAAVSSLDVFQQRRQLEALRGEIITARLRRTLLENQLAVLLGRAPGTQPERPSGNFPEPPPLPATGLPAALVRRRPDLRAAYARVAAADQRTAAAIADRFPAVRLSGRLNTSGSDSGDLFRNWLANLAANLTAPLIDGGRRAAEARRARAAAAELLHRYGGAVLTALREVEDALAAEAQERLLLANIRRQVGLAGDELERARERYRNGASDYLPVLNAIQALQRLQRQALTEERRSIEARVDLYHALGGGWRLEPAAGGND